MSEFQNYYELMRRRVELADSTGYFIRTVSIREYDQLLEKGYTSEFRWYMMVNHCIPPQLVNWMHFGGGPRDYKHAILITPDTMNSLGLEIDRPDTSQIDFWYPAVQLFMRNNVPRGLIRDATGLVGEIASQVQKPYDSIQIVKATSHSIPIKVLGNLPTL